MTMLPLDTANSAAVATVDCAIIVVTYNSARHIASFVSSIQAAAGSRTWRLIVVDNASRDGTRDLVPNASNISCISAGANVGYSAGINIGRRYAGSCRTLLVSNPDVRLGQGAIEHLYEAVTARGHGAAVPMLHDAKGSLMRSLRHEPSVGGQLGEALFGDRFSRRPAWLSEIIRDRASYHRPQLVEWATGAAIMISAACNDLVGRWDESYFLFSEEVDYARRIRAHGFTIAYVPEAVAVHDEGGSGRPTSMLGLAVVNRLRYFRSYHGRWASTMYAGTLLLEMLMRSSSRHHRQAALVLAKAIPPAILSNRFETGRST